ncbi:MAG: cytochrome c biogenesis protein ResB [Dehalococcoidia bacterium]
MARGEQALGRAKAVAQGLDPLHVLWRLFTSVRFAILLIALVALAGLLGVVLPQVPPNIRDSPAAVGRWLAEQEGKFGPLTDVMYRLGLFQVFNAPWFTALVAVLVVSVTVCTANRLPAVWRTVRHAQRRVPDSYFQRARHRVALAAAEPSALEAVLRRHHYRVERHEGEGATYLFADRFPWASLGTFASHLALILFIAAAVVSRLTSFDAQLFIGEGTSVPVFPVQERRQLQVQLADAVGRFDAQGRSLDYRSRLVIYDQGREAKRCTSTVNDPCTYGGYRFSQAAYFGFGAALQVRDLSNGNVIYKETLALFDRMPSPHVVVRDEAGQVLAEETLVLGEQVADAYGTVMVLPEEGRRFWLGVRPEDEERREWDLVVFGLEPRRDAARLVLPPGERATAGDLEFEFARLGRNPAVVAPDVPLPDGGSEVVLVQMGNAVYGSVETSSGRALDLAYVDPEQPPRLYISGGGLALAGLRPGESAVLGDYEYTFLGQREFAGIQVKQDRSDNIIWVATGLLLVGLGITFYVPRRRLWAKVTADRTYLAGIAGHMVNFAKEMRRLGAEAGCPDVGEEEARVEGDG